MIQKKTTSVFKLTKHINQFALSAPGYLEGSEMNEKLKEKIEQRKSIDIKLHVEVKMED